MPAISFSTMKAQILDGSKKQTIRPNISGYWLRFCKGNKLIGYWKMRSNKPGERELLFKSHLSEDPFIVTYGDLLTDDELMQKDGFVGAGDAYVSWFYDHYGSVLEHRNKEFVVIRWL